MSTNKKLKNAIDMAYKGDLTAIIEYRHGSSKRRVVTKKYVSFEERWNLYKETTEYNKLLSSMKGVKAPYNENIIWYAFSAGYNCKK